MDRGYLAMSAQINQLRVQFKPMSVAQKKTFIDNLKIKLHGKNNPTYTAFLNECVRQYNAELRGGGQPSSANAVAVQKDSFSPPVVVSPTKKGSYFEGKFLHGLGWSLLSIIITVFTFGIGFPWAFCIMYRWKINNTVVGGQRLRFNGNGGSLIGNWIVWWFFSVISCGIYLYWVPRSLRAWKVKHMSFENGTKRKSHFDGSVFDYVGRMLLGSLISIITLGFGVPWAVCNIYEWEINNTVIEGRRLKFTGTAAGLMGKWIIFMLLSVITCGIFVLFIKNSLYKWQVEHTAFADK